MAITQRTIPIEHRCISYTPWAINANSADVSGNETLLAAPTTKEGKLGRIRIRDVRISCNSAISVWLNEGTTALLGPFYFAASSVGPFVHMHFEEPISLSEGSALKVDASGAGYVTVIANGDIIYPMPRERAIASEFTSTTTTSTSTSSIRRIRHRASTRIWP